MKKVLVVDNDLVMLQFLEDFISKEGHEVVTAPGGLPAMDIVKTYTPDIIFVDLVMPNIEGRKLVKILRGIPKLEDTFIVVLSAVAAEEVAGAGDLMADACIAKGPLNEMGQHILSVIKRSDNSDCSTDI